jgi:hypothetical protein
MDWATSRVDDVEFRPSKAAQFVVLGLLSETLRLISKSRDQRVDDLSLK